MRFSNFSSSLLISIFILTIILIGCNSEDAPDSLIEPNLLDKNPIIDTDEMVFIPAGEVMIGTNEKTEDTYITITACGEDTSLTTDVENELEVDIFTERELQQSNVYLHCLLNHLQVLQIDLLIILMQQY